MISARDFILTTHNQMLPKPCSCGCGKPLEARVSGQRHTMAGREVNADCYFDSFGQTLEKHPVGGSGLRRRASMGLG